MNEPTAIVPSLRYRDCDAAIGFLGEALGDDGKLALEASVAVRNEPFEAGDPGC